MKTNKLLVFLALMLAIVSLFGIFQPKGEASPAEPIKLKFSNFMPPAASYSVLIEKWAAELGKRTQGRVSITVYAGGTLLSGPETYDGVLTGIADIGYSLPQYTRGRFPLVKAIELPIGFPSSEVASRAAWEAYKKFKPKEFAETKVLFMHTPSPGALHTKKPVRNLEDLQGMEIASSGRERIAKLLGAVPVSAPNPEVYDMLSKGIVKGCLTSSDALKTFRFAEVTGYTTIIHSSVALFYVVMNLNVWNSVPPDIKKIIEQYCDEQLPYIAKAWDAASEGGIEYAKSGGQVIVTLSSQEMSRWQKRVQPMIDEYLAEMKEKGLPGREFLDEIFRLKEKYSR